MTLTDIVFPDCHLCRGLRAVIGISLAFVLLFYSWQLIQISIEMNLLERRKELDELRRKH